MSLLQDLLSDSAGLAPDAVSHLTLLLADWQILADLSFADLLLFVAVPGGSRRSAYLCVGQIRPYTAQTIYMEDLVGESFPASSRPMVGRAFYEGRVIRDTDPDWSTGVPVREEAIPVRMGDGIVAVVTREANVSTARSPSQLELTYLHSAGDLAQMLADGTFPYASSPISQGELSPRVGDGIVRVDGDGHIVYASPNAISAYRHLGTMDRIIGQHLAEVDPDPELLLLGLEQAASVQTEVDRDGTVVLRRVLPLVREGRVVAGLLIVREITELRRTERALRVKDATIREIHHRVKNNLQTVASLLRLQARRLHTDEAREALAESVRRISSIALVHETLSEESQEKVDFERIARRIVDMLTDGLGNPDAPVEMRVEGSPGDLPAEVATPLALVLTELLQNSLEHAFPSHMEPSHMEPARMEPARMEPSRMEPSRMENGEGKQDHLTEGRVILRFDRTPATLRVLVLDNGVGLPKGVALERMANLGLQIARTLVESELGGTFGTLPPDRTVAPGVRSLGGTTFELVVPLP